jgi:hypothetical protein
MCRNLCIIIAKSVERRLVGAILVRMVLLKAVFDAADMKPLFAPSLENRELASS